MKNVECEILLKMDVQKCSTLAKLWWWCLIWTSGHESSNRHGFYGIVRENFHYKHSRIQRSFIWEMENVTVFECGSTITIKAQIMRINVCFSNVGALAQRMHIFMVLCKSFFISVLFSEAWLQWIQDSSLSRFLPNRWRKKISGIKTNKKKKQGQFVDLKWSQKNCCYINLWEKMFEIWFGHRKTFWKPSHLSRKIIVKLIKL